MELIISNYCRVNGYLVYTQHNPVVSFIGDNQQFLSEWHDNAEIKYERYYKLDMICRLALLALNSTLENVEIDDSSKFGMVLSNTNSSMITDTAYFSKTFSTDHTINKNPALFTYTLPNIMMGEFCIYKQLTGENIFFITPKFDSKLLFDYSMILFGNELVNRCLIGYIDVMDNKPEVLVCYIEKGAYDKGKNIIFNNKNLRKLWKM